MPVNVCKECKYETHVSTRYYTCGQARCNNPELLAMKRYNCQPDKIDGGWVNNECTKFRDSMPSDTCDFFKKK